VGNSILILWFGQAPINCNCTEAAGQPANLSNPFNDVDTNQPSQAKTDLAAFSRLYLVEFSDGEAIEIPETYFLKEEG
jgi:hypothetical protein